MSVVLRARASVPQSLVRVVGKMQTSDATRLSALLKADAETQKIMAHAPIGWVDEKPFVALLSLAHRQLGDDVYTRAVHDASMLMLKTGVVRAAQSAFLLFKKPGLSAYAKWAQRIWAISFQGLVLTYDGDDEGAGIRLTLAGAPSGGFDKPLVLGAAGVVQTCYTLERSTGKVEVLAYRAHDASVQLRLRAAARAA